MPRPPLLPNFVPCFTAAGAEALRESAEQLRDFQLRAPIDVTIADAEGLEADYLAKLNYHHHRSPCRRPASAAGASRRAGLSSTCRGLAGIGNR